MYQNNIIGQTAPQQFNPALSPLQQARASGVVQEYKFVSFKPKSQLKELKSVLKAEPKKFLGIKYGKNSISKTGVLSVVFIIFGNKEIICVHLFL